MHCDTSAVWPTAAARALLDAFPDLAADVNKSGRTAQETFEQGIDAEEPAEAAPTPAAASSSHKSKRDQQLGGASDGVIDNAAAARAGALGQCSIKCGAGWFA